MWLFPHMTKVTCLHSHNFMKIELDDVMVNNLLIFLNRIEYKGLEEAQAITQIVNIITQAKLQEQQQTKLNNIKPTNKENKQ